MEGRGGEWRGRGQLEEELPKGTTVHRLVSGYDCNVGCISYATFLPFPGLWTLQLVPPTLLCGCLGSRRA